MAEYHQSWRLAASARDAEQETHVERGNLVLVENLDRRAAFPGNRRRPIRKLARRQRIAGLVRELTCQIGALTEQPAARDSTLATRHTFRRRIDEIRRDDDQPGRWTESRFTRLVRRAVELGERQPLRE